MDKKKPAYMLIMVNLLILVMITAAVPFPHSASLASISGKSDLVSLKIVNESSGYVYLWLNGPSFYYFSVKPGETKIYTVMRGEYSKNVSYCGARDSSVIDLTKHTKLVMPICGANTRQSPNSPHVVDITNTIKIVKVTVENDADSRVLAILTGPSTYVFSLDRDEAKEYTIAKGDYEVKYFACGKFGVREFSAFFNSILRLKCPK
jgi:hypothetical protein